MSCSRILQGWMSTACFLYSQTSTTSLLTILQVKTLPCVEPHHGHRDLQRINTFPSVTTNIVTFCRHDRGCYDRGCDNPCLSYLPRPINDQHDTPISCSLKPALRGPPINFITPVTSPPSHGFKIRAQSSSSFLNRLSAISLPVIDLLILYLNHFSQST